MKLSPKTKNFISTIQLLSLLAAGFGVALFDPLVYLFPDKEFFLTRTYFAVLCLLFFCSVFTKPLSASAKQNLLLSFIAVLWFAAVQRQHQLFDMGTDSLSLFAIAYLVAFPFAAVTDDNGQKTGMKWLGKIYIAASVLLVLCAVALLLDTVPEVLTDRIFWDGTRLQPIWHPNVGACIFMIAIGFTLYFLIQADSKRKKILFALLAAVQFCGLSLTHSRAAILLTCALLGGGVFFMIWKGGLKHFLASAAAAFAVMVALFLFSDALFDFHTEALTSQPVQQETIRQEEINAPVPEEDIPFASEAISPSAPVTEEPAQNVHNTTQSPQGSLINDIWTLNNRTFIWKAAFTAIQDNPAMRIWGTKYVGAEISYRFGLPIAHAHNSWIQVRMELGIPGLLIALLYTGIALARCAWILFCRRADPGKKVLALMVLCIMAAGFLEPLLFIGDISTMFANFIFFFLTGCLDDWCRKLSAKKV